MSAREALGTALSLQFSRFVSLQAWLYVRDESITMGGPTGGKLFQRRTEPREHAPGSDLKRVAEHATRADSASNRSSSSRMPRMSHSDL